MAIEKINNVGSHSGSASGLRCGCRFISALEVGGPILFVKLCDLHEAGARMAGKPLNTIDDLAAVFRENAGKAMNQLMGGM